MKILVLSFFVYGFSGWIWESIIIPIFKREPFFNAGFLNGPVIPIYGFGAVLVMLLFHEGKEYTIYELFLYGGIAACVLEYFTSYVMEKLFKRRWWDYSNMPLNYQGRICFGGFIVFGLFSVIAIRYVQPHLSDFLSGINDTLAIIITVVLVILFIQDIIFTSKVAYRLEDHIQDIALLLEKEKEKLRTFREENIKIKEVVSSMEELKRRQKRLIKAYPYIIKREYRKKKEDEKVSRE
ncbi:MAG: putative ABC transporter permease [Coprobacillaceae bacterium]